MEGGGDSGASGGGDGGVIAGGGSHAVNQHRSSKKERIQAAASQVAHKAASAVRGGAQQQAYTNVPGEDDSGYVAYAFPDKGGLYDYVAHPPRSVHCFFKRLISNFGYKFTTMIGVNYLCVKGLLLGVTGGVRLSYCKKTLNVDGSQCQLMGAVAATPWAIKGAIGVLSDAYPLLGYHKASYIMASSLIGSVAFALLAGLDISSPNGAAVLFFFTNLEIATADLLCEGRYAEEMQQKPKTGSTMVSYVWGLIQFGSLVSACFVGPLADAYDPKIIFWFCVPLAASIVIPTGLGYLGDPKVAPDRRGIDWDKMRKHPNIIGYSLLMASFAFGNGLIGVCFPGSHEVQVTYAVFATIVLSVLAFRWLPRQLAMCNFYMFISNVLYINIGGAQDFWFTGDDKCVPGGPAFDYTYYNTYTAVVGAFTGWLGIVVFQATMSGWSFRTLFWVTTVIQVVASGFDMIMVARLNVAAGISDKFFYMFGDAVIAPAIGMFSAMPGLVLTSKLVPKGLESTTYALLAGFQNFGGVVNSQIGIYAIQVAGIKTTEPCNFDNLNLLIGVCHCLLPLVAVPLTFILIPDKKMTDKFVNDDDDDIAGEGYEPQVDEDDGGGGVEMEALSRLSPKNE